MDHLNLHIQLKPSEIILEVQKGGVGIDSETLPYYHDLSDKLIEALDKILIRGRIDVVFVLSYAIDGTIGNERTAYNIARAFAEGVISRFSSR